MFTGLVFKSLCTILLYVFIVPSSFNPFIEYVGKLINHIFLWRFEMWNSLHKLGTAILQ